MKTEGERDRLRYEQVGRFVADMDAEFNRQRDKMMADAKRWVWFSAQIVAGNMDALQDAFHAFEEPDTCTQEQLDDATDAAIAKATGAHHDRHCCAPGV